MSFEFTEVEHPFIKQLRAFVLEQRFWIYSKLAHLQEAYHTPAFWARVERHAGFEAYVRITAPRKPF